MPRRSGGEVIALDTAREIPTPVVAQSDAAAGPSLRDYLTILSKRRYVIATFFSILVTVAGLWAWRQPKVYRAAATVEISPTAPRILGNGVQEVTDNGPGMQWATKDFYETEYQIMSSRAVAQRVADKLGLATDEQFLGVSGIRDPEARKAAMRRIDPAEVLQSEIHVEPVRDSRIARISVEDTSADRAMRIANTLAESYIEYNMERKADTTRDASIWLEEQLGTLKTKLESSEVNLHEFKRSHDILNASYEDKQSIASQRLLSLNEALTHVRTHRAELDSRLHSLQEARQKLANGDLDAMASVPGIAGNVMLDQLNMTRLQLVEEKVAVEQKYLEKHPKRAEVEARLATVNEEMKREMNKLVRVAETEEKEEADTQRQIEDLIAKAKLEAFETTQYEIDYNRYKREMEGNQRLYDLVLQRYKDADLAGRLRTNNVQMLDSALVPVNPIKPNKKVILIVAALLGLFGGIGLALLFEYLDNTIKTHDDVERFLNAPFLGIVPSIREAGQEQLSVAERGRNRDLYAHRRPKSSVSECVRAVRTNLLFMTPDKPLKRLLVTSAGPQDGKTTFVSNIAITMAQSGSRTLVIDTDMRRPRVHRIYGLPNDSGLSTLILQSTRLDDVVQQTMVPNLFILPCGPIPPNPSELLHTERFKQILEEADGKFDRVILDSPPVAAVTDALILAGSVDGVVLVVKAGKTVGEIAMRTKRSLDDIKARLFGVVINDLDLDRRGYGSYYYYQRYGYYYGEKPSEA
jgi:capsular exopolysaccharide synthesis family protein